MKALATAGSATEAVRMAGYNVSTVSAATTIAHENMTKLDISGVMDKAGLSDEVLISSLTLGLLDANKIDAYTGEHSPDYSVRHKYLETALKLKKLLGANADAAPVANFFQFIQEQKNQYGD